MAGAPMAQLLAVTLLCFCVTNVWAVIKPGYCPKEKTSSFSNGKACSNDDACGGSYKCCTYDGTSRCTAAVIPNYEATLYIVDLPQKSKEVNYLTTYMENNFDDIATIGDVSVERFDMCVRVSLSLRTDSESRVDLKIASLEDDPVSIPNFNNGPFLITSIRNDTLCPGAIPDFVAHLFFLDVNGTITASEIQVKVEELVSGIGKGWHFTHKNVGRCVEMLMVAVMPTTDDEHAAMDALDSLEESGLEYKENKPVITVTSDNGEASYCFDKYLQTECDPGHSFCADGQICIPDDSFCNGEDDCGDMSDEADCNPGCEGDSAPCLDTRVCLPSHAFCDGVADCIDRSDESNCHFETYTFKVTLETTWNKAMAKTKFISSIATFMSTTFLQLSNFSHSEILDIRESDNRPEILVRLHFRGHLDATQVIRKQNGILDGVINMGFLVYRIHSLSSEYHGACKKKDCAQGLCAMHDHKAFCRCSDGQDPITCQITDCRGDKDYCQSDDPKACKYIQHLSSYACQCPPGFAGPQCKVDACSLLGDNVCGEDGTCNGSLQNFTLCHCGGNNWGPLCDERGMSMAMPMCRLQWMLHRDFLNHLNGTGLVKNDFLNGNTLVHQLEALGYKNLQMPTCQTQDDENPGYYHHICVYNLHNVSAGHICYCTDDNGTYTGMDFIDGSCQEPNTFDPEEKPGRCPPAELGGVVFDCLNDASCNGTQKCCRVGPSRKCMEPYVVKGGECPVPPAGGTSWKCDHDGECNGNLKCCDEGDALLCRHPAYITRFQVMLTFNANWRNRYDNLEGQEMRELREKLEENFSTMDGLINVTIVKAMSGSVKVITEVSVSPENTLEDVQRATDELKGRQIRFDNANRAVSEATLVAPGFCGSMGCNTGTCGNTTMGGKCLCPRGVYGDRCQFSDPCEGGMCQNGGTCHSASTQGESGLEYSFNCSCPSGFNGRLCQVPVCSVMPEGLCNDGVCQGKLDDGRLCSCPLRTKGIFCQDKGTEVPYTECERRKRQNDYLALVLRGEETMDSGIDSNELKSTLGFLGIEWLPLFTCQHGGAYSLTADLLNVKTPNTVRRVCVDKEGEEEPDCQSKVCSTIAERNSEPLCQNEATCMGNINRQICNCTGTGYHGAICDKLGEEDATSCELQHDLAQTIVDALKSEVGVPGLSSPEVRSMVSQLMTDIGREKLWIPDCSKGGIFAYRGCEHQVSNVNSKVCFCVDELLQRRDDVPSSNTDLPDCPVAGGACVEFSSDPCGEFGQCLGDLNAGMLCQCQDTHSGIFCQTEQPSTATDCQRRSELSNYLLSMLHGFQEPPADLTGVQQLLTTAGIDRLEVPTCNQQGGYKYICTYFTDKTAIDECRCTNDDGTYLSESASCDGIAKPGECPTTSASSPSDESCNNDLECPDSLKCCLAGSRRQCRVPVYVSIFNCNVTVNAAWKSEYTNLFGSSMNSFKTQLEDVFRTLNGFMSVELLGSRKSSVKVTAAVKASADVTAEEIHNALLRLRAAEISIGGSDSDVTNAVYTAPAICDNVDCGTGYCLDTSYGARCACLPGTSGDRCQDIVQACNCSAGKHCIRGAFPDTLDCACHPETDMTCRLPLWYCKGKAECQATEKCVHRKDCDTAKDDGCEIKSSCISKDEPHPCDDQPCAHGGLCVTNDNGNDYTCQCKQGFGGEHCQINMGVCNSVPAAVCATGQACVGDVHVGVVCRCPDGRAGINCDQPGHSPCEKKKAMMSDLAKISAMTLKVPGVTKTQLTHMMTAITDALGSPTLTEVNCTSDGAYAPVQCDVHLTTGVKACRCVNKDGSPLASNVMTYTGFPPCTAPYDPVSTGQHLCNTTLSSACRNGGKCAGNVMNGTVCRCTSSYTGIFCQDKISAGQTPVVAKSMCQLGLQVWQMMREAETSDDRSFVPELQALQGKLFHASTNMPSEMIKANCTGEGEFRKIQCAYNFGTNKPVACYCYHATGVIISSKAKTPGETECQASDSSHCPSRACGLTRCEHGLALDIHGCPICQCRHPCQLKCDHDPVKRCVVEIQQECGRENWEGVCTSGVCRQRQKAGMCPASVSANLTTLNTLKSNRISECDVTCLDDADCGANLKCCGLCGAKCVQPVGEFTCETHRESALQEFEFVKQVQEAMTQGLVDVAAAPRIVRAKLEDVAQINDFWIPSCSNDGFYGLSQCNTLVMPKDSKYTTSVCFCVDRQGYAIPGTNTDKISDKDCEAKPGKCRFLQPNSSAVYNCQDDYDCQDDNKCCPDGLGYLCIAPVLHQQGQVANLDDVVTSMCGFTPSSCGLHGQCVNQLYTSGRVCNCINNYYGPFCDEGGQESSSMTPCKRRKQVYDFIMDVVDEKLTEALIRQGRLRYPGSPLVFTQPRCLGDGEYQPSLCTVDMDTKQKVHCFCVGRKGQPLVGTEVPAKEDPPPCASLNPCDLGEPLRNVDTGDVVPCGGKDGQCQLGYTCRAGQYGEFFCCRDRLSDRDVCLLPPNPGSSEGCSGSTSKRFYFQPSSKTCKSFDYKGCNDYNPNFATKDACESRCIRKEHPGRCPSSTVVAGRAVCSDTCSVDTDCSEDQKCCESTCGRRCVLSLNPTGGVCEVGEPLLMRETREAVSCNTDQDCGDGYRCRSRSCCIHRTEKICLQPKLEGFCSASQTRYHYDAASKQCHSFTYTGCGGNDNNFLTNDDCCTACGGEGRCKDGVCPAPRPVLSVSCDRGCHGDGDCTSNQICCPTSCGGSSCVTAKPSAEASQSCRDHLHDYLTQMSRSSGCYLRYRPRCDEEGNWQPQQCNDKLGICWCVTPNGYVVKTTRVRGIAQCQWVTPAMTAEADRLGRDGNDGSDDNCEVCPGGGQVHCCNADLCLQVCTAHPTAMCRIDPCGGCRAVFYTPDNKEVSCTQDLKPCLLERHKALLAQQQFGIIALSGKTRESTQDPELTSVQDEKNQAPYVVDGIPQKCHLVPESGSCRAYSPQWYYNVLTSRCEAFVFTLCGGNDNRFQTPEQCYRECNADASPCQSKVCSGGKSCYLKHRSDCTSGTCGATTACRESLGDHEMLGVYVPTCDSEGDYAFRQCYDKVCWCSKPSGAYNRGLTADIHGLQCNSGGPQKSVSVVNCPGGASSAQVACSDGCADAVCPGYPSARCVVDMCTCATRFIASDGTTVNCKADNCKTDVFTRAANTCPNDKLCGGEGPARCEYHDPCASSLCANNPCAVCVSDPCKGSLVFIDRLTDREIDRDTCNTIQHTSCEMRQCEVAWLNARAGDNDQRLPTPLCQDDGSYQPLQLRSDGSEYCVNFFGEPVDVEPAECVMETLASLTMDVIYDAEYDKVVPGREGKITDAFLEVMEEIGLLAEMFSDIELLDGSLVIRSEIVSVSSSPMDLAVVRALILSRAVSGALTLRVDGLVLRVKQDGGVEVLPIVAVPEPEVDSAGMSGGAIAAVIIVVLIAAAAGGMAFYMLYYRRRINPDAPHPLELLQRCPVPMPAFLRNMIGKPDDSKDNDFVGQPLDEAYVKVRL